LFPPHPSHTTSRSPHSILIPCFPLILVTRLGHHSIQYSFFVSLIIVTRLAHHHIQYSFLVSPSS
jgi:hypothetical protein